ncbi:nuclear factor of activated T-cells 5 isoform X3 [Homalodisca vitripennis]|uniref:nuclear factor of activated T-cells 5 isoform X3 n=1 Tax=Homalodisca vitripennis TaxID=197043 RepID=UPI001EEB0292|nr:nuclear factor of activated T-cells 5 isoform X3 [Homalodisca vitripennis]
MLLKHLKSQNRLKTAFMGKSPRTGGMVKLTAGLMTVVPKSHRKVIKVASKRPAAILRAPASAVKREHIPVDPCDNSNDSGLGFDHHIDYHSSIASHPTLCFSDKETGWQTEEPAEAKRRRLEIKLESDDANDNFTFPQTVRQVPRAICVPVRARTSRVVSVPAPLSSQLSATSQNGLTQLLIVCQPEQQHRARYQTEGSRGAVKDRTGNGFPVVKLVGYDGPATLQVFIGTDQGRVVPHMFYQACRVSGKNSTPCVEKKVDGTIVIEVDIEPSKDMVVTCDCVGILKERNVDVEHRFPEEGTGRTKKKSTRCRMVFRTTITNPDGSQETLQVTSQPIVCTQPPGVPEICKKSLSSCSVRGGQELFVLGKNFLKDTRVLFQEGDSTNPSWSQSVQPDKEFLQQSHLVCTVPPYHRVDISEPVTIRLLVESSGKASEPHTFLYLPDTSPPHSDNNTVLVPEGNVVTNSISSQVKFLKQAQRCRGSVIFHQRRYNKNGGSPGVFPSHLPQPVAASLLMSSETPVTATFIPSQTSTGREDNIHPVMMWDKTMPVDVMMPPPPPALLPISGRRSSVQMIVPEPLEPENLKQEVSEEAPKPLSDLSSSQQPSMDTFRRFVTNNTLPSITVESYLSNIEGNAAFGNKVVKSQLISEMPRIMIPSSTVVSKPLASSDSSSLLTTVEPMLVSQPVGMTFDGRNMCASSSVSQASHENISVIVPSPLIQKKSSESLVSQEIQQQEQIPQSQSVGLDLLMRSALNERPPTMTEKLDAFVNSAADSHISPNPNSTITSVITENSVVNPINDMVVNTATNMSKLQEQNMSPITQSSAISMSPQTSPHHSSANVGDGSLCSIINSPQNTSGQSHVVSSIQATLEHHLNSQSANSAQANINDLIKTSQTVTAGQAQVYSNLQSSIEQLTSQALSSSQMTHSEINSIIQSSQPTPTSQAHVMSNLQSLEQHLSPPPVNSGQIIHPDLNNLMQSSQSSTQEHTLANLQASLEQQMSSHNMTSQPQMNLSNLIQSASQESTREAQALSNLQASLEQHLSQGLNSTQMIHSESIQPTNLSMGSIGKTIQTSTQSPTISENQSLSNLQASLEHHMSSQILSSVQAAHESLTNGNISMNTLNSSVPTSPQIQIAVSQAQVLSNLQASLEHHLASQVAASVQSIHETVTSSQMTTNLNSPVENSSQVAVSQGQTLSGLQMSLEHLSPRVMTSPQPTHENMSVGSISLNNTMQTSPVQISVSQAQTLSDLHASLEHHLSSNVMASSQPSETIIPVERLNNQIPTSPQQSSNQNLSSFQASIDHLSSQVLSSPQSSHSEHNLSINDSRSMDLTSPLSLMNSQTINVVSDTSSTNSPVMILSPNSRQSPSSVLTTPGLSMSNTPTMALSPVNTLAMDMNPSNIVLNASHTMVSAADITMGNPPTLLSQPDVQMQTSPGVQLQTSISQFEQVASRIPDKMAAMSQYQHGQGLQGMDKEVDRKDPAGYMIQPGTVQPHANYEIKPQPVKKCEELANELTQMSEHDLISYINPSCFDTV